MTTTGWMQVRGGLGGNRRWRQARRGRRAATSVALVAVLVAGCGGEVAGVAARGARTAASVERPSLPSDTGSAGTPATTSLPTTSSRPAPTGSGTTPPETTPPETRTTPPETTPPETRTTPPETTRSGAEPTSRATTKATVTATLGDSGAIDVGSPSAKIVLDVYEEPMCSPCATFAARYGPDIAAAALSGKARVRFRIANFLDKQSHSKNYSTRAIAALLTVLAYDRDPRTLLAVQDAIFDDRNQPIEGSDADLSDAQLATLAQQHGAGTESVAAIRTGLVRKTAAATARLTRSYMTAQKVSGVPWVQVDGRAVDLDDPQWLSKALTG